MGVSPEIARWLQGLRPSAHLPPTPRAASGLIYCFRLYPGFCSPTARVTPGYRLPPCGLSISARIRSQAPIPHPPANRRFAEFLSPEGRQDE